MGLFEQLLGGVVGDFGTTQQKGSLMDLATNVIQTQPGGLSGLLDQFRSAGMGQEADSWVSTGQNMPVSGTQVTSALGSGNVQSMAQKLGLPPGAMAGALAALLPIVIDQLTPKGRVEQSGDMSGMLASLKSQFLDQA
jgi:uncharacterized protein YidB (DUF937 family)